MMVGKLIIVTLIVFWNVENYFDPFDDKLVLDEEYVYGGGKWWSWDRFLKKRNNIAKTLMLIGGKYNNMPDIIGLAEVENRFVLNKLIYETPLARQKYKIIHKDSEDRRGIDVALLYREDRFKPLLSQSIKVNLGENKRTRDILYVQGLILSNNDTINIFVCHFPSKYGGAKYSAPSRAKASKVLANKCDSLSLDNIICMGDFNDSHDSEALNLLNILNPKLESHSQKGTIRFKGIWETIDNFYTSDDIEGKAKIFYSPFLLEDDATYLGEKPFRTYIGPRYNGGVSDHLPIVLKIEKIY